MSCKMKMANYDTNELLLPIVYRNDTTLLPVFERIERTRYLQGNPCGGSYQRQCNLMENERSCSKSFYPSTNGQCYKHCGEFTNVCCMQEVKTGNEFYKPNMALGDDGCYTNSIFGHEVYCHNNICQKRKIMPGES